MDRLELLKSFSLPVVGLVLCGCAGSAIESTSAWGTMAESDYELTVTFDDSGGTSASSTFTVTSR